jgi:hypothetical protein
MSVFANTLAEDIATAVATTPGVSFNAGTGMLTFSGASRLDIVRPTVSSGVGTLTLSDASDGGIGVSSALVTVGAPATAPNPFSFAAVTDSPLNAIHTSNAITVAGLDGPAVITIANGGTYSINSTSAAAFVDTPGVVNNGDLVRRRAPSAGAYETQIIYQTTIGTMTVDWPITTAVEDLSSDIEDHFFSLSFSPTFITEGQPFTSTIIRGGHVLQVGETVSVAYVKSAGDASLDTDFQNTHDEDCTAAAAAVTGVTYDETTNRFTFDHTSPTSFQITRTSIIDEPGPDVKTLTMQLTTASHGTVTDGAKTLAIMDVEPVIRVSGSTTIAAISEDAAVGTVIGPLTVTGGAGTYTVSFTDDAGGAFAIVDGDLVTNTNFDFETQSTYQFVLHADNGEGNAFDQPFSLSIANVAEGVTWQYAGLVALRAA